jgi:hypothetical protein
MRCLPFYTAGCWIVSTEWIRDSLKAKQILNEIPYEVKGSVKACVQHAPRRAREYFEQVRSSMLSLVGCLCMFYALQSLVATGSAWPESLFVSALCQYCGIVVRQLSEPRSTAVTAGSIIDCWRSSHCDVECGRIHCPCQGVHA